MPLLAITGTKNAEVKKIPLRQRSTLYFFNFQRSCINLAHKYFCKINSDL